MRPTRFPKRRLTKNKWQLLGDSDSYTKAVSLNRFPQLTLRQIYKKAVNEMMNLVGRKFNKLTVLERAGSANGRSIWKCQCECGIITYVTKSNLGKTKSCGCICAEARKSNLRHGETKTRLYDIWRSMKSRCFYKNNKSYARYGGRGISVCEEWMTYEPFRDWALSHGYNPDAPYGKTTLDRIDVNGDYSPENCRLVDMKTQANNKRNNVYIKINGETKTMKEWAEIYGVSYKTVINRHWRGVSTEKLFYKGDMRLKGDRDVIALG